MDAQASVSPPPARGRIARKSVLLVVLAVAFLPLGVPRWLDHGAATTGANAAARFAEICRDHGGTPVDAAGAGAAHQRCTVRYGNHVYVMDAITPGGFDADTAHFQRQGCELARSEQKGSGARRVTFVYHARTGVCERRS
jgi:hypothetical protein